MWYSIVNLFVFLIGVYTVWALARREYYDEEKVIDVALASSVVGLLASRIAFFLTPAGSSELSIITSGDNVWFGLARFFQLTNGIVIWIGIIAFFATAILLFVRWKWPFWPVMGFLVLGASLSGLLFEVLHYLRTQQLHNEGILAVGLLLCALIVVYEYSLGGNDVIRSFKEGFQKAYRERVRKSNP